jgi:hypothetical protein
MLLWNYFTRQIYSCSFHIFKLNNLKVIHDLYSRCLIEILSKTTWFMGMEAVPFILFATPSVLVLEDGYDKV